MSNNIYHNRSLSIIDNSINEYRASEEIKHPGMQGEARETFFSNIIKPFIVSGYSFGSGKVVDCYNNQSDQVDLIIFDEGVLPPVLYDEAGRRGSFPIESVKYWIEIKSTVSKRAVRDCHKKIKSLTDLKYVPEVDSDLSHFARGFFAFSSDLHGDQKKELERFREEFSEFDTNPTIDFICIMGRGYWYFNQTYRKWIYYPTNENHLEIVGLISGISNTLSEEKCYAHPAKIGNYLLSQIDSKLVLDQNPIS